MLYLAIDQHRKQLTVNLRNEQGDVLVKRQVSTEWPRVRSFLEEVRKTSGGIPGQGTLIPTDDFQPIAARGLNRGSGHVARLVPDLGL